MVNEDKKKILSEIYTDIKHPASFSSQERLYQAAKQFDPSITRKDVKSWARHETTYSLHRSSRIHFPRRKTIVSSIDDQWQMDILSLIPLARHNGNYKYILTAIDIFSRFGFARGLKTKGGAEVSMALEDIFVTEQRQPHLIQVDQGKEFYNHNVQSVLKKRNIHMFSVFSSTKASLVERYNRSIRARLDRYFTENNTRRWIDILPDIIKNYNASKHRGIGMAPKDVSIKNEEELWHKQYGNEFLKTSVGMFKFNIGDNVRIARILSTRFAKEGEEKWTREIFTIKYRRATRPPTYKITDLQGDLIKGSFYEHQLQAVDMPPPDHQYLVDVVKRRKRMGKTEYFVHYRGWPSTFDEWIDRKQLFSSQKRV